MSAQAVGLARAAAKDVGEIAANCGQARTLLQQAANVLFAAKKGSEEGKGKVAAATQIVTGGTGTGQQLQVRCGQTEIKLEEVIKLLQGAIQRVEDTAGHAGGVAGDIFNWANTLSH